jgi:Domain of unknown function (DUF2760)
MEPYQTALLTVAGVLVVEVAALAALTGGFARFGLAWQAFRRVSADAAFAEKVNALLNPPPPEPPKPVKRSAEPLRLLALLQREGRILDFFLEDISGAPDDLVGAGVRELHRKAQTVLKEHLTLEPVLPQKEEETVEVPAGFDPSAIRLTGNVSGQPPFRGTLKHHGWRVKDYKLAAPPEGQDEFVVAPAEVDLP